MAKKKQAAGKATEQAKQENVSFEQSLAELETIVSQLEDGELTMDEALASYERGIGRLKRCYQLLDAAEQKIELLVGTDDDGNARTKPFSDAAQS